MGLNYSKLCLNIFKLTPFADFQSNKHIKNLKRKKKKNHLKSGLHIYLATKIMVMEMFVHLGIEDSVKLGF